MNSKKRSELENFNILADWSIFIVYFIELLHSVDSLSFLQFQYQNKKKKEIKYVFMFVFGFD